MNLSVEEFGAALIRTQDLDPVYSVFLGAGMGEAQSLRWMMAYWMFYHVGVSSWLSEQPDFWGAARVAAENTEPSPLGGRWPRGAERRHFRGGVCLRAIDSLSAQSAEERLSTLRTERHYRAVIRRVTSWPMFGPWIAFKAADMLERCLGWPVKFDRDVGLIYSEPMLGLSMIADEAGADLEDVYGGLLKYFGNNHRAPPGGDRACGPQEVETVLCKYKSYRNGRYWVGKDIHEVRAALPGWGETAERALAAAPVELPRP